MSNKKKANYFKKSQRDVLRDNLKRVHPTEGTNRENGTADEDYDATDFQPDKESTATTAKITQYSPAPTGIPSGMSESQQPNLLSYIGTIVVSLGALGIFISILVTVNNIKERQNDIRDSVNVIKSNVEKQVIITDEMRKENIRGTENLYERLKDLICPPGKKK